MVKRNLRRPNQPLVVDESEFPDPGLIKSWSNYRRAVSVTRSCIRCKGP